MNINKLHISLIVTIYFMLTTIPLHATQAIYRTEFEINKTNFCDTIPIVFENGQIYIDVEMNGQKRRLNLDTGAAQGALYGNAASGARELGNVVSKDAAGNEDTVKVLALPRICFSSGLKLNGYVATLYNTGNIKRKYDGVLGFDFFNSGINAKIDTRAGVLIVSDRKNVFAHESGHKLRYRLKWFAPYLKISPFVRHIDEVLFDTGFRHLYTMNDDSFRSHSYKSKQVMEQVTDSARGSFAIGNLGAESLSKIYFLKLNRLQWGDYRFLDVSALTTKGSSKIGAAILNYGSIIIEPKRKTITFQPYGSPDGVRVANTLPSMAFVPVNGKPTIGIVARNSDAYKAGARCGDTILSIDGTPMTSFADLLSFPFIYGRENLFLLKSRKGKMKEVRIRRNEK